MAYILHIDTSGDTGTIALAVNGNVLSSRTNTDTRNYASVINEYINEVLQEAGIALKDLKAITVCGGPGSYTGLRIGLSTAKAICYVHEIPLMQVDRLLLLVLNSYYDNFCKYDEYAAVLPARDKEYFIAIYNNSLATVMAAKHMFASEMQILIDEQRKKILVTGEMKDELVLPDNNTFTYNRGTDIDTTHWAKYAYSRFQVGKFDDISLSEPFYLKQVYTHK